MAKPASASPSPQGSPQDPPAGTPGPHAQETEAAIVADEGVEDDAYDFDDDASSSTSITSSIMRYRFENGRRYHAYKDGAYPGPNDEIEIERLDLQHNLFDLTFDGKLILCPVESENLHRVLDAGTGTGTWAIDFADANPNAEVVGVDLSPIQPGFVPPNLAFFVDDLEDEWTYNHPFDLVYARMMTGSISNWPRFFEQAFANLSPGGYIELVDISFPFECDDDSLPEKCDLYQWSALMLEASKNFKRPLDSAKDYRDQLTEAGFVNIEQQKFRWPTNRWPKDPHYKEIGLWEYENVGKNLSGLSLGLFTRGLGWTAEETEVFLVNVRKQFRDPKYHAYSPIHVIYAQKPLEE